MYSNSVQLLQSSPMTRGKYTACFWTLKTQLFPLSNILHAIHEECLWYCFVHKVCLLLAKKKTLCNASASSWPSWWTRWMCINVTKFPQDSVSTRFVVTDKVQSRPGPPTKTKPTSFQRYVFSSGGTSCMVTAVDPLFVLNCSKRVSSALLSSALGSWTVFSKAGLELPMPPDTEGIHSSFIGTLLWATDGLIFWRGLEPEVPRTLDTWVRLATSERTIKITYSVVLVIVLLFLYYSLDISFNNYYAEFTLLYCFSTINYLALQWTLTKKSLFVFFYLRHFAVSVCKIHKVLKTNPLRR